MSETETESEDLIDKVDLSECPNGVEIDAEGMDDDYTITIDFYEGQTRLIVEKPASGRPLSESDSDGQFHVVHSEGDTEVVALELENGPEGPRTE